MGGLDGSVEVNNCHLMAVGALDGSIDAKVVVIGLSEGLPIDG